MVWGSGSCLTFLGLYAQSNAILIEDLFGLGRGQKGKSMWKAIIIAILWVVWLERNQRIFLENEMLVEDLFEKVKFLLPFGLLQINHLRTFHCPWFCLVGKIFWFRCSFSGLSYPFWFVCLFWFLVFCSFLDGSLICPIFLYRFHLMNEIFISY